MESGLRQENAPLTENDGFRKAPEPKCLFADLPVVNTEMLPLPCQQRFQRVEMKFCINILPPQEKVMKDEKSDLQHQPGDKGFLRLAGAEALTSFFARSA